MLTVDTLHYTTKCVPTELATCMHLYEMHAVYLDVIRMPYINQCHAM